MRLYLSATSPYARKVRVVAHELGLRDLIEEVPVDPYLSAENFVALNPLSKVPTLVTDKGQSLPDSTLIVEYLQTRGRGLLSLPRGAARWALLRRQWLAEGILDAAVACQLESRRPESEQSPAFVARQKAAIVRSLDALEAEAADLLAEDAVRTVEVTIGVALGYLDLRQKALDWRHGHDRLAGWYFRFAQRPSMLATQPPG